MESIVGPEFSNIQSETGRMGMDQRTWKTWREVRQALAIGGINTLGGMSKVGSGFLVLARMYNEPISAWGHDYQDTTSQTVRGDIMRWFQL